ncbi:S1/P1 nuclease [Parasediminibacterium sp. JCM 36343]|uniref:S1/P1 nuclease n=1 Tax=Parasediminibacterium sp. JCM 36343 TaxID=3374279 RepID=UPI00397A4DC3
MKKTIITLFVIASLFSMPKISFAWGARGHRLVAEIAFHYLDDSTKDIVKHYLRKTSIEDAATWMDENKSNSYYDFMRSWHYVDIDRDSVYHVSSEKNLLTVLNSVIASLKHRENLSDSKIKEYIMMAFHLIGDLHQPLHTGYTEDKGGNTVQVTAPAYAGNLHGFWDTDIIESQNITLDDCIKMYDSFTPVEIKRIQRINVLSWMNESRSYLDRVYDFKDGTIPQSYVDANAPLVKKQLLIAGLRLASVLKEVFKTVPAPVQ